MDATQDLAEVHLLVLSPDYLASAPCVHEMTRAIATDPTFRAGNVLPLVRERCTLPTSITIPNPLYVSLVDDTKGDKWDLVTSRCGVDFGATGAEWLRVRDLVREALADGRSLNLVVLGAAVDRKGLFRQLQEDLQGRLALVDLASGATAGRQGLITEILHVMGMTGEVQKPPNDLRDLHVGVMAASPSPVLLAFAHFDVMKTRARNYKDDFFSALKHLVDERAAGGIPRAVCDAVASHEFA